MKAITQEKLLKEAAVLETLWKNDPLLKKQKIIKEKQIRKTTGKQVVTQVVHF